MLICNTITMEPTIFCHTTALHALRSSRTWRGCIPWPALFSERQRDVLRAANGHRDRIDVPWLEGLGIIPKREGDASGPMHLLVANRSVHAKRPGIRTHQCSIDLPEGSLLEVAAGCYVCSPALTLVQLAATAERADILKIAYEFMGALHAARRAGRRGQPGRTGPDHPVAQTISTPAAKNQGLRNRARPSPPPCRALALPPRDRHHAAADHTGSTRWVWSQDAEPELQG